MKKRKFDCKSLLKVIGFRGEFPYWTINELYEDNKNIFSERQKIWLEYIRTNIEISIGKQMLNIQQLMNLIGFNGECPYLTLEDIHNDSELLFTPNQKLKLECVKNISLELGEDFENENMEKTDE